MRKQGRAVSLNYRIDCVDKRLTLLVRLPRWWICSQHLIVHCIKCYRNVLEKKTEITWWYDSGITVNHFSCKTADVLCWNLCWSSCVLYSQSVSQSEVTNHTAGIMHCFSHVAFGPLCNLFPFSNSHDFHEDFDSWLISWTRCTVDSESTDVRTACNDFFCAQYLVL